MYICMSINYINIKSLFIFYNVKIMECGPYLGVCMHLLMMVYEGVVWAYPHHPSCSTVWSFQLVQQRNL